MSEEQLKAFLEKVQGDTSLQEKLKAAADADAVTAIAKEAGFSISADDLTNAQSELSDEELEGVAGGDCAWGRNFSCGASFGDEANRWIEAFGRGGHAAGSWYQGKQR
ncbi:Nif11-like leader peptide family natural product precursor [Synechococcus sp. AH-551-N17]|nr:Nif11-like leader peptide family natural product precursor [Synechococcus sp. AH-551-N17]